VSGHDNHLDVGTTVHIVDDHPTFRATARLILEAEGYDVVGEAPDGHTALTEAGRLHPDLVLLDVNLPDTDGFQVARRLTAEHGAPAVVLISSRDSSDFGPLVSGSGARGFISKGDLSGAALAELLP
jgi:DNA-binding NarL/FixJ family response regulator